MRVLKWPGVIGETLVIPAHENAEIVLAGQGPGQGVDQFSVWIMDELVDGIDRGATGWQRSFVVVGTGHVAPANSTWRKSWVAGPFVWHLFELSTTEISA